MKKIAAAAVALLILTLALCAAQAENRFSCDLFSIDLPKTVTRVDEKALAGYESVVQRDYPGAGETLLIAKDKAGDTVIYIAKGAGAAPQEAAKRAAELLLGDSSAAAEQNIAGLTAWGFACSVGDTRFDICYLQSGGDSIVIGVAGMNPDEIAKLLSSIRF